jgi:hypothetical protein
LIGDKNLSLGGQTDKANSNEQKIKWRKSKKKTERKKKSLTDLFLRRVLNDHKKWHLFAKNEKKKFC